MIICSAYMLILTRSSHWTVVLLSCIIQNVCLLYDVLVVLMTSTSICLVPSPFLEKKNAISGYIVIVCRGVSSFFGLADSSVIINALFCELGVAQRTQK